MVGDGLGRKPPSWATAAPSSNRDSDCDCDCGRSQPRPKCDCGQAAPLYLHFLVSLLLLLLLLLLHARPPSPLASDPSAQTFPTWILRAELLCSPSSSLVLSPTARNDSHSSVPSSTHPALPAFSVQCTIRVTPFSSIHWQPALDCSIEQLGLLYPAVKGGCPVIMSCSFSAQARAAKNSVMWRPPLPHGHRCEAGNPVHP